MLIGAPSDVQLLSTASTAIAVTIRRSLIHALDRPGGRALLAWLTTWYARNKMGRGHDLSVFYDDVWIRRLGPCYLADSPRYPYYGDTVTDSERDFRSIFDDTYDWWFHVYKPRMGDVIIDVGAGTGSDTLVFSRSVGINGTVLAVEAHPTTFRCLTKLCQWNRLENTICLQCAIIDRQGVVYIDDSSDYRASSVGRLPDNGRSDKIVSGVSLDEICAEYAIAKVNFLKMNVEGAERLAIRGMNDVIRQTDYVAIACHDFRANRGDGEQFRTRSLVIDFLRSNHFRIVTRDDDPRPWARDHIHAIREVDNDRQRR